MHRAWLIAAEDAPFPGLVAAARKLGESVGAVVVGRRELADRVARAVDRVDWFPITPGVPTEAWAPAVAAHLASLGAVVVLAGSGPTSRAILGAVAVRLRAPVLASVQEVTATTAGVELSRLVFGGIAVERDAVTGPVCLALEGGSANGADMARDPVEVRLVEGTALPVTCATDQVPVPIGRDLASAARVIGVGRGLRDPGFLEEVERLAGALRAEIACSRPVAEDLGWLPRDRYLGVSGRRIAPELYLMLGISGELQHMIGVRDADLIVAVNIDPRAPVVADSDIAVIADLRAFVPALIRQLALVERRRSGA